MLSVNGHLRLHLLESLDFPSNKTPLCIDELRKSEWSPEFERLRRNRLVMGAFRYAPLHAPGKPQWNRVEAILNRAHKYLITGNDELLVDIANMALLEFEEGTHPKKHFNSEDDGDHAKRRT